MLSGRGEPQEAISWCREMRRGPLDRESLLEADITLGRALILVDNQSDAQAVLNEAIDSGDTLKGYSDEAHFLKAISHLRAEQWERASEQFSFVSKASASYAKAQTYSERVVEGRDLPSKNPGLATVLSIAPGLGYLYTGNKGTAMASAAVNGLFAWGTYSAWKRKEYGVGMVIGLFSLGWYTGNLYGGYASAYRFNERAKREFKETFTW